MAELELTAGTIEYEDTGGDGPGAGAARRPGDGRLGVGSDGRGAASRSPLRRPHAAAGRAPQADGRGRRPLAARASRTWSRELLERLELRGGDARAERSRGGAGAGGREPRARGAAGDHLVRGLRELPAGPARQEHAADRDRARRHLPRDAGAAPARRCGACRSPSAGWPSVRCPTSCSTAGWSRCRASARCGATFAST